MFALNASAGLSVAGVLAAVVLVLASGVVVVATRSAARRRAHADAALAESRRRGELLFSISAEPMWIWDADTLRIVDANEAATRLLGWSRQELLRMTVTELQLDASPRDLRSRPYSGDWRHRRKDGATVWTVVATSPVHHDGLDARLSVVRDLTSERDADARTQAIVANASDAILTIDLDGRIESVNPAAERMFGHRGDELVGSPISELLQTAEGAPIIAPELAVGREVIGARADGSVFPLELAVTDVELGDRTIWTVIARDISERKVLETRISSQATHDPLTGLPNRALFIERLNRALASGGAGKPVAALFCDLDRFKVVNDSLGHTSGDALLFEVATRFRTALGPTDTLARFGGDEFVVLLEDLEDASDALRTADHLARSLDAPVSVGAKQIHVTASIGIAVGAAGRDSAEVLLRDADAAMFRAKTNGRARVEVSDADLRKQAQERLEIEAAMRAGIALDEFVVHYQPEIELASGSIIGLEALVRWERRGMATSSPGSFLAIAEETGLIVPIGEGVLRQACEEAARWHAELGDRAPIVWVNVSARQLASLDLVPMVKRALAGLPRPTALGLEITETDIVPDDDVSRGVMTALVDAGVKLAIDDFGTGFASLSYLWRFPAHVVKIDQSFVRRMEGDEDAIVLVRAMIDMAHSLGKTVVAEGVETEAQLHLLADLGADTVQGYYLGRPQPATAIDSLLTV